MIKNKSFFYLIFLMLFLCTQISNTKAANTYTMLKNWKNTKTIEVRKGNDLNQDDKADYIINFENSTANQIKTDIENVRVYTKNGNKYIYYILPNKNISVLNGKIEIIFNDVIKNKYGEQYNLKMTLSNITFNSYNKNNAKGNMLYMAMIPKQERPTVENYAWNIGKDEKYVFKKYEASDKTSSVGSVAKDLNMRDGKTYNNIFDQGVSYDIMLEVIDDDGTPQKGKYIFAIRDLDVGNAKELYGDGSEGVNLKSGFDLTTIKVTKKSYVMGKQFTLDKKTVFRITGSQGDDESSNSGFSVVADAEKCIFTWTVGRSCGSAFCNFAQAKWKYDIVGSRYRLLNSSGKITQIPEIGTEYDSEAKLTKSSLEIKRDSESNTNLKSLGYQYLGVYKGTYDKKASLDSSVISTTVTSSDTIKRVTFLYQLLDTKITVYYKDKDTNEDIASPEEKTPGKIAKKDISGYEYVGGQLDGGKDIGSKTTTITVSDDNKTHEIIFWYEKQVKVTVKHVLLSSPTDSLSTGKLIEGNGLINPEKPKYFKQLSSMTVKTKLSNLNTGSIKYVYAEKSSLDGNEETNTLGKVTVSKDGKDHTVIFGYVRQEVKINVMGACTQNGHSVSFTGKNPIKKRLDINETINESAYTGKKGKLENYKYTGQYTVIYGKSYWLDEQPDQTGDAATITMDDTNYQQDVTVVFFYESPYHLTVNYKYYNKKTKETRNLTKNEIEVGNIDSIIIPTNAKTVESGTSSKYVNYDVQISPNVSVTKNGFKQYGKEKYTISFIPGESDYEVTFLYTDANPYLIFGPPEDDPNGPNDPIYPEGKDYTTLQTEYGTGISLDNRYNQLIQNSASKVWVLDKEGKVSIKLAYTSNAQISGGANAYVIFPFDVYVGTEAELKKANTEIPVTLKVVANNDANGSDVLTGELKVNIPVWVKEGEHIITGKVVYTSEDGRGITTTGTAKAKVTVVGQIYDFSITNLHDGDKIWKNSLFTNPVLKTKTGEYEADTLPVGQGNAQQNVKYNQGIMKGTKFYFSVNTLGSDNGYIAIKPDFYYVPKDGGSLKKAYLYVNNQKLPETITRLTSITDVNRTTAEYTKERSTGLSIDTYANEYKNKTIVEIGNYYKIQIGPALRTPYVNFVSNINKKTIANLSADSGMTQADLLKKVSHWYGDYTIPNSVTYKDVDENDLPKDGNLVVYFSIISLKADGKTEYLGYNLPSPDTNDGKTQWKAEGLAEKVILPHTVVGATTGPEAAEAGVKGGSGASGGVPVAIYGPLSTSQNYDTTGTH